MVYLAFPVSKHLISEPNTANGSNA